MSVRKKLLLIILTEIVELPVLVVSPDFPQRLLFIVPSWLPYCEAAKRQKQLRATYTIVSAYER